MPNYRLLNNINYPSDLKKLNVKELKELAVELRTELIDAVSETGGHLGAGLGVVELTIALHYVFNTPKDKLVWDVGHQAYPHKILTGRKHQIETLRKENGLYGFVKRSESEYDTFGTAHSSTSISAGLGIKIALELKKDNSKVVCVIGDGALSAGMAYEALNNAAAMSKELIVVLNDNDMSIDQPVGAKSSYLSKLLSSNSYSNIRSIIKKISNKKNLFSKLQDKLNARKVINVLSKRYLTRNGGYSRIIKAGFRYGDKAPLAIIELVDRDINAKKVDIKKKVKENKSKTTPEKNKETKT